MLDLIYFLATVLFFLLALAYLSFCQNLRKGANDK